MRRKASLPTMLLGHTPLSQTASFHLPPGSRRLCQRSVLARPSPSLLPARRAPLPSPLRPAAPHPLWVSAPSLTCLHTRPVVQSHAIALFDFSRSRDCGGQDQAHQLCSRKQAIEKKNKDLLMKREEYRIEFTVGFFYSCIFHHFFCLFCFGGEYLSLRLYVKLEVCSLSSWLLNKAFRALLLAMFCLQVKTHILQFLISLI